MNRRLRFTVEIIIVSCAFWGLNLIHTAYGKSGLVRIPQEERVSALIPLPTMAEFCEISNDDGVPLFYSTSFDSGMGIAVYMDPAQCGVDYPYPFQITDVHFYLYEPLGEDYLWPVDIQVNVRAISGGDKCNGPDSVLCSEIFSIPSDSAYPVMMNLSLAQPYCVMRPFFVEVMYQSRKNTSTLPSLVMDTEIPNAPDTCDNWFLDTLGYHGWVDYWGVESLPGDGIIRATGYVSSSECPRDSVRISSDTTCLTADARTSIRVTNFYPVAAMTIPLHYVTDCLSLTVDSVSFSGTRIENWEIKNVSIKADTVALSLIADAGGGTPPLPSGEGSIAHIHFSTDCDTEHVNDTCFIAFDTTTFQPENQHLLFVHNYGTEFIPGFEPGTTFVALHRPGDVNGSCVINIGDVVYLINYLFKGGPEPCPLDAGDVNGDCIVDIGDVVYLINYLFKGGPPPVCGCASNPNSAGNCVEVRPTTAYRR